MPQIFHDFGFDGYICGCGTHVIYKGETLFHTELSPDACHDIVEACHDLGFYAFFEGSKQVYVDKRQMYYKPLQDLVKYFGEAQGQNVIVNDCPTYDVFDKFTAWYDPKFSNIKKLQEFLSMDFKYIDREGDFCEVIPGGCNKATGIKLVLEKLNIPLANAYAFGDGENDAEMLSYVPNSVIMAKGPAWLKERVTLVTDNAEDDGILNAMKRLEII